MKAAVKKKTAPPFVYVRDDFCNHSEIIGAQSDSKMREMCGGVLVKALKRSTNKNITSGRWPLGSFAHLTCKSSSGSGLLADVVLLVQLH